MACRALSLLPQFCCSIDFRSIYRRRNAPISCRGNRNYLSCAVNNNCCYLRKKISPDKIRTRTIRCNERYLYFQHKNLEVSNLSTSGFLLLFLQSPLQCSYFRKEKLAYFQKLSSTSCSKENNHTSWIWPFFILNKSIPFISNLSPLLCSATKVTFAATKQPLLEAQFVITLNVPLLFLTNFPRCAPKSCFPAITPERGLFPGAWSADSFGRLVESLG